MKSELLSYLGFDPAYILIGLATFCLILLILVIVLITKVGNFKKKYKVFLTGNDAKSLEETLIDRLDIVDKLVAADKRTKKEIREINENLNTTFQKVGIRKYDAFNEMGGKLSFALALLDKKDDGFLINSVHSREGCYTYIKEIVRGKSIIVLSDEEKVALDSAMKLIEADVE